MIYFKHPQEEMKHFTELSFDGKLYKKINENINFDDIVPNEVYKITHNNFVIGEFIKTKNGTVFVKKGEGAPTIYKEAQEENEYKQLKIYEDIGELVWEESLVRDHQNTAKTKEIKEELSEDFIKIAEEKL